MFHLFKRKKISSTECVDIIEGIVYEHLAVSYYSRGNQSWLSNLFSNTVFLLTNGDRHDIITVLLNNAVTEWRWTNAITKR